MFSVLVGFLLAGELASAANFSSPFQCLIETLSNVDDSSPAQSTNSSNFPVVTVSQGSLRGRKVTSSQTGGVYYSFQGIPFAQPPVGELRFKAPREATPWTGVREATSQAPICPQYDNGPIRGSEDCLTLDVYTPQLPGTKQSRRLPVMVWIHGGGNFGSGNAVNYGPDFLVAKNVILVNIKYRLGVLGLLNVRSPIVSQNNGLKDQVAALKWVQANIGRFGGDKNKVTIFGQSFGSSAVEYLILSPLTRGLFHRAISHSGNAIDRWAYVEPARAEERAFVLGRALGLTSNNTEDLVNLLKTASIEQLLINQETAFTAEDRLRAADIAFLTTKEERSAENSQIFLPDSPLNIFKSGNYRKVPYMMGFTEQETKFAYLGYFLNVSSWDEISGNMEQFVPPELKIPLGSQRSRELAAEIKNLYFGNATPTVSTIRNLIELGNDAFFIQGVRRSILHRLRTSSTPVYVYQFSYVGALSLSEFCQFGYTFRGAAHTDDLGYLFWISRVNATATSRDLTTRERMTTMWTNFAKTGNPNGNVGTTWEPVSDSCKKYLNIDRELSMRDLDQLRPNKFAFWDRTYEPLDN